MIVITPFTLESIVGKPFKIIFSTIAALVLLSVAAVCILPFVVDPNSFKPEIIEVVKNRTGREMTLDGDLKLSLFPWIGISTGKITLSNAPGFQDRPFATIEAGNLKVLLLPLLAKKIEIGRIVLKNPLINLARNQQGIANWDDLTQAGKPPAPVIDAAGEPDSPAAPAAALAAFAVGGVAIENGQVNWDNRQTGTHLELKELNLNTDKFSLDQPLAIAATLIASNSESQAPQSVKLATELTVHPNLDTFALRHSDVQISRLDEANPVTASATALTIDDAALDIGRQTAKITGLQIKSGDITLLAELSGSSIIDRPSFHGPVSIAPFNPVKFMQQRAIAVPVMQDAAALSKLAVNFELTASADAAELQNIKLSLDDSQVNGSAAIKNFAKPEIGFNVDIDRLDVDRYLPPVDQAAKPIAGPGLLLAAAAFTLPVDGLRKLNIDGTVALNKLKAYGLAMQDVRINLNAKDGAVSTQQSIKQFYQGSYSGNLGINVQGDKPVLAMNDKIEHLHIEPLLKDYRGAARISGIVNASTQLQSQGRNADELKASLNGKLSLLIKDSVVQGFNLQKIIDQGKTLLKGSSLSPDYKNEQSLFSEISATAVIANGLIQNNDLVATSSKLRVDGNGSINLNNEALDYKIDAKLLNAEGASSDPVKINIAGTLGKPVYTVDLASLLTEKNKAKVEKLINKLDKKLGPGLGNLLKGFLK